MIGSESILLTGLIWLSCISLAWGQAVVINFPGRTGTYRGAIADFGFQFDTSEIYRARIMLPPEPDDPFLCSYPPSLQGAPRMESSYPIALFVRYGACPHDDKLGVALALQANLSNDIRYIIMYNDDIFRPSDVLRLTHTDLNVDSLGVVFVSTRSATFTLSIMQDYALASAKSPFLSSNNTDWDMDVLLSYLNLEYGTNESVSRPVLAFYWLRFVLFGLLILSPCLRAAYLWCAGGGRVSFRRNERGRIVGLEFTYPANDWFAPSRRDDRPGLSARLTEEQVLALPEITFVAASPTSESEDNDEETGGRAQVDSGMLEDEEKGQATETNTQQSESPAVSSLAELQSNENHRTTSCTTCSICIDDFQPGERIRLLPACGHAFHTDCIMPWLTERQGCCPLCKTAVLGAEHDGDENDTAENTSAQDNDASTHDRPDHPPA